jgi:hypothetical protein
MEAYKKEFIEFMVRSGVLTFGDFVTKSGRRTPYFVNTGNYVTGEQMQKLGGFYAECIKANIKEKLTRCSARHIRESRCALRFLWLYTPNSMKT